MKPAVAKLRQALRDGVEEEPVECGLVGKHDAVEFLWRGKNPVVNWESLPLFWLASLPDFESV